MNKSAHEQFIDEVAVELDSLVKLPADEFAGVIRAFNLTTLANVRNLISMRVLTLTNAKERLVNVMSKLPESHIDYPAYTQTVNDIYAQLVLHEDKTVLCNKELERRGVDLKNPE